MGSLYRYIFLIIIVIFVVHYVGAVHFSSGTDLDIFVQSGTFQFFRTGRRDDLGVQWRASSCWSSVDFSFVVTDRSSSCWNPVDPAIQIVILVGSCRIFVQIFWSDDLFVHLAGSFCVANGYLGTWSVKVEDLLLLVADGCR